MNVNSIIHSRSLRGSLIVGSVAGLAFLLTACGGSGGAQAPAAASAALATPTKAAAAAAVTKPVTETTAVTSTVKTEAAPAKTAAVTETKAITEAAPAETTTVTETKVMTEAAAANTAAMTETKATTETTVAAAAALVMLNENGTHGKILTDDKGMALYIFDKDSTDKSTCTGDCLTKWSPLTVAAAADLKAGEGVTGKLATIKREDDGKLQVTINGMPLYHYYEDKQPGDAKGQAVGDVWWLVGAEGNKISQ